MSRSVNKIILVGNVGSDPEVRTVGQGTKLAKFSLATSSTYKDKESTQWHRLNAWGKLADVVEQWVKKGDRLYVEGRVEYSQTEHEGTTRYWTDIHVNELVMLGTSGAKSEPEPAKRGTGMDAELPF